MNADDLEDMSRYQLVDEVIRRWQGIRAHRDSTGHGCAGTRPSADPFSSQVHK